MTYSQSMTIEKSIPIIMTNDVPCIKVNINGKPIKFLLDTGASQSIIDITYQKHLELVVWESKNSKVMGVGGLSEGYDLEDVQLRDMNGIVLHTKFIGTKFGTVQRSLRIAGILGGDFFKHGWQIDYQNQRLIKVSYSNDVLVAN